MEMRGSLTEVTEEMDILFFVLVYGYVRGILYSELFKKIDVK